MTPHVICERTVQKKNPTPENKEDGETMFLRHAA